MKEKKIPKACLPAGRNDRNNFLNSTVLITLLCLFFTLKKNNHANIIKNIFLRGTDYQSVHFR